jgi:hypothetical protein
MPVSNISSIRSNRLMINSTIRTYFRLNKLRSMLTITSKNELGLLPEGGPGGRVDGGGWVDGGGCVDGGGPLIGGGSLIGGGWDGGGREGSGGGLVTGGGLSNSRPGKRTFSVSITFVISWARACSGLSPTSPAKCRPTALPLLASTHIDPESPPMLISPGAEPGLGIIRKTCSNKWVPASR